MDCGRIVVNKALVQALIECDIVHMADAPVTFRSGLVSPLSVNCRRMGNFPLLRNSILDYLTNQLSGHIRGWYEAPTRHVSVAGVPMGGVLFGAPLADRLGMAFGYVAHQKGFGEQLLVHGFDTIQGRKILCVEDVIATAYSSARQIAQMRMHGADVRAIVSLVSYELPEASQQFGGLNVIHTTLAPFTALRYEMGICGRFSPAQLRTLDHWHEDPYMWTKEYSLARENQKNKA